MKRQQNQRGLLCATESVRLRARVVALEGQVAVAPPHVTGG
jgi:hypothetical protein